MREGEQIDLSPTSTRKAVQCHSVLIVEVYEKLVLPTLPANAGPNPMAGKNATRSPRATKPTRTQLRTLAQSSSNNMHAAALMACDVPVH